MKERLSGQRFALVTGAGGFLGSAMSRRLVRDGWFVTGIGHGHNPLEEVANWRFLRGDVDRDELATLMRRKRFDLVFHAAGTGSVGRAEANPAVELDRSVGSVEALLHALKFASPPPVVIFPSSAAVYGDTGRSPVHEEGVVKPLSNYGRHKLLAEERLVDAARRRSYRIALVRYGSIYGPGLRKQLLWDICTRLGSGMKSLDLHGSGEERRDFVHVEDAVVIALHAAEMTQPSVPLVLNGATGESVMIRTVAELLLDGFGVTVPIRFDGSRPPHDPECIVLSTGNLSKTGFRRGWSIKRGTREYAAWSRSVFNVTGDSNCSGGCS